MYKDFPTLSTKVCGLEKSLNSLRDHVKSQDKQIAQCLQSERETAAALIKLQRDYNELSKYTLSLEEYCLDLDVNIRKRHLILTGIEESPAETNTGRSRETDDEGNEMEVEDSNFNPTLSVAFDTLHSIHDTLLIEDLDVAYRLGKKGPSPRPILVKFSKESIRNEVNRKRFNLKDSDESKNVFLNEDLPAKVNAYRADLRCLVAHAKSKNVNAKLVGNRVSIDNKIYGHRDIDKLPEGLRLSDAKVMDTPKGLAFQSKHAFLSNFFLTKVNYNGIQFISAEHAYQHTRATFLGMHAKAEDVLRATKPEEAKRAAMNLPNSKEWDHCKQKVMKEIVLAKFTQNLEIQNKLLNTGDCPLLEATYDSYWGCGLPLSARKLKSGEWHGKNYLGIILAECRFELRRDNALRAYRQSSVSSPTPIAQNVNMNVPPPAMSNTGQRHHDSLKHPVKHSGRSSRQATSANQSRSVNQQPNQLQQPQWPQQMMFSQQSFPYPPPMPNYYMFPPMQNMPYPIIQPQAAPNQTQTDAAGTLSQSYNYTSGSPTSSITGYSNQGDRRLSYDPGLSPVIHV